MRFSVYIIFVLLFIGCNSKKPKHPEQPEHSKPNVLLIYLDDLGYGDVGIYNEESKIKTPNMDRLAKEGMRFTQAHTPAAICGPSRYGLITGRYPWRRGKEGMGNGEKFRDIFIEQNRMTMASMLRDHGYNTAQVGKWGLRHNYSEAVKQGKEPGRIDSYDFPNKRLLGSQLVGFDYSWCMTHLFPAEGATQIGHSKNQLENGLPVDSTLKLDDPHQWLPGSANKIVEYLEVFKGAKENPKLSIDSNKPFFLYWDPPSPHLPIVPNKEFIGASEAGLYGDFVMEIDHYVGSILDALDRLNLAENTVVIFSSDNGPELYAYERIQEYQHYSMGNLRGVKRDLYEGGTNVPLIVRWTNKVKKESITTEPVNLTDIVATLADIIGYQVPHNSAEDSQSLLPILLGQKFEKPIRKPIVYHTIDGRFAIRKGTMVYIDAPSGDQSGEPQWFKNEAGVFSHEQEVELFDLSKDPKQLYNIADVNSSIVIDMKFNLDSILEESSNLSNIEK